MPTYDELTEELTMFIETHFQKNFDPKRYILHSDFIDFIWENTDFNMIKVKKILNSWQDLEVHNGKVYGLYCFTYPDINRKDEDEDEVSSDDGISDDSISDDSDPDDLVDYDTS